MPELEGIIEARALATADAQHDRPKRSKQAVLMSVRARIGRRFKNYETQYAVLAYNETYARTKGESNDTANLRPS